MNKDKGFIQVPREMFEHHFWTEERELTKFEALLDLLQVASYRRSKRVVNGKTIEIGVGELVASVRYLAERWKWGKNRVHRFLRDNERDGLLTTRRDSGETVISLTKSMQSRVGLDNKRDSGGTVEGTPVGTSAGQRRDKVEEGKERRRKKEPPQPPKGGGADAPLLPHGEKFKEAWEEWKQHRKEAKSKLTPSTVKRQLATLSRLSEAEAIQTIHNSIEKGYKGLFPKPAEEAKETVPLHKQIDPELGW